MNEYSNGYKHFDLEKLAKRMSFFQHLLEQINPQSIEDLLINAAAMERCAQELRERAAALHREQEEKRKEI